jgi:lactate dehydrogenase-like 2-hydroxyacid dehydrogenase
MGIFGLGRIGSAVARRAKEFDMHIIYHTRQGRNIQIDNELGAKYVSVDHPWKTWLLHILVVE